MSQPPFTRPTRLRTGTRTSDRNVSQKGDEPLLYFCRDGKAYVVCDGGLVAKAEGLFRPQV